MVKLIESLEIYAPLSWERKQARKYYNKSKSNKLCYNKTLLKLEQDAKRCYIKENGSEWAQIPADDQRIKNKRKIRLYEKVDGIMLIKGIGFY